MKFLKQGLFVLAIIASGWMLKDTSASISIPYVFVPFSTIQSAQMNSNFSTLGTNALNVNGDTMLGDLKFTDGLYDIGKSGATRPRDVFTQRDVTVGRNLVGLGTFALTGNETHTTGSTLTVGTNLLITSDKVNALMLTGTIPNANLPSIACYGVVVGKTANYGASLCDIVEITANSGLTITLPAASTCTSTSNHVGLKNDVAATVTVARTGSDTIDGVAGSFTTYGVQNESYDFVCNAALTGWMVR